MQKLGKTSVLPTRFLNLNFLKMKKNSNYHPIYAFDPPLPPLVSLFAPLCLTNATPYPQNALNTPRPDGRKNLAKNLLFWHAIPVKSSIAIYKNKQIYIKLYTLHKKHFKNNY